ncbi:MAG: hypothetical protein KKF98_01600 [Bacteroidetes bacterium]|jgi:hypothetical protein|nr:hypothetical protein [Bacteroidota bacterium]
MRKLVLITLVLCFASMIQAQEKEEMKLLFPRTNKNGRVSHGGYGSLTFGYTKIDNQDAVLIGGRLAWVANHRFAMGLAGQGFFNNLDKDYDYYNPGDYSLAGGYGGLFIEPIIMPNYPVHISIPVIMGVGGVAATKRDNWEQYEYNNNYYYDSDVFLVFEPGVDVEFNIARFFRLAIGGSYRMTNGINLRYKYIDDFNVEQETIVAKDALDGFNLKLSLKFGWF